MKRRRFLMGIGVIPLLGVSSAFEGDKAQKHKIKGPLRVHPQNPRYFTDDGKRAIYLTGSHTWSDLQDMGPSDPPPAFDFDAYLDFLSQHNHNFIRLWRWEAPRYRYGQGAVSFCEPHPWPRTGPGLARDGKPKFDLTKFNEAYFKRLRQRVEAALRRGIFVSIMLFEGHSLQCADEGRDFHPFHPDNNINGIGWKDWHEYYTLSNPKILELQEAYVRKVIDTVNELENVLYEISNEAGGYSTEWQYHMIRFVKAYEAKKRKQHPVGMTFQYQGGTNANLFNSPADWISPNPEGGYRDDPPPNDGRKVVLNDTDHLWGEGGNPQWVWKSFTRGHHPLFMDRIVALTSKTVTWAGRKAEDIPGAEEIRKAMGVTREVAERVDLAAMLPLPDIASTRYCLAAPGKQYIVYVPGGGELTVNLSDAKGEFRAEWVHPIEGTTRNGGVLEGGAQRTLKPPFEGDAVLLLFGIRSRA
jgi:hypothetical protein